MTEIWRQVPGYPTYEASTEGNIRSRRNNKILAVFPRNKNGYLNIGLVAPGATKQTQFMVHQVIAMTFIEGYDRADHSKVVDHIDHNKFNNKADNLRWITPSENIRHSWAYRKSLSNSNNI